MSVLPIASIILSVISVFIAVWSFLRTRQLQEFEYAPRLQLINMKQAFSTGKVFDFAAGLKNYGVKPVKIDRVYMDYGSKEYPDKRLHHEIEGDFYLSSEEEREFQFHLSKGDAEKTMKDFSTNSCMFYLRILYYDRKGKVREIIRDLGGYNRESAVFIVPRGETLT